MITPVHKPKPSSQSTEVKIEESIEESSAETLTDDKPVVVNVDNDDGDDGELHTVDVSQ